MGSREVPEPRYFEAGECFLTPPNVEHLMRFPVDTVMISASRLTRTRDIHEADVVRCQLLQDLLAASQ